MRRTIFFSNVPALLFPPFTIHKSQKAGKYCGRMCDVSIATFVYFLLVKCASVFFKKKEETISLVNIFSSEKIQNDLESWGRYNMAIFSQVSKKLSETGYDGDATQCKRKMNKIKWSVILLKTLTTVTMATTYLHQSCRVTPL